MGFCPYVAVAHQSLLAVRENVFPAIRDAEYFIFIDFRREVVLGGSTREHRGSVFSHQELGIASYLEKELIAFQEVGVLQLDGLMGHLQANARTFANRATLVDEIIGVVEARNWSPAWRNELTLELNSPVYDDSPRGSTDGPLGRFYHLRVTNLHRFEVATNCYAFLFSAIRESNGKPEQFGTVEFKWAGTILPSVRIGPLSYRVLDAFWLDHQHPTSPRFNCFADSGRYIPQFHGPGTWLLDFGVVSDNLPPVTQRFRLSLTGNLTSTTLVAVK